MKHKKIIKVCAGKSCRTFGAHRIMSEIEEELGIKHGKKDSSIDLDFYPCVGFCGSAPNVIVNDILLPNTDTKQILEEINKAKK